MIKLTRRDLLSGAAAAATLPLLEACGSSEPAAAIRRGAEPPPLPGLPAFAFSEGQRRTLSAAVARLVPAENAGDWNAADAGAVEYLEQLLNAFSGAGTPKIFGGGPTRAEFARFHALPRIKVLAWQKEILRLREQYAAGLDELNRLARGPFAVLPGDFSALSPPAQDAILDSQDLQQTRFFHDLFDHTMEAVYSHPVYGGNRDYRAWRQLGYQGDVHGVRFPGGHDPGADAQPWRKYGGYSPEEMGQEGLAEGPVT